MWRRWSGPDDSWWRRTAGRIVRLPGVRPPLPRCVGRHREDADLRHSLRQPFGVVGRHPPAVDAAGSLERAARRCAVVGIVVRHPFREGQGAGPEDLLHLLLREDIRTVASERDDTRRGSGRRGCRRRRRRRGGRRCGDGIGRGSRRATAEQEDGGDHQTGGASHRKGGGLMERLCHSARRGRADRRRPGVRRRGWSPSSGRSDAR